VSTGQADIARIVLKEPGVSDVAHYTRRVKWLAIVHLALFLLSPVGFVLPVGHGELFVTLAQRSNVETLTILFFLVFFAYFAVVTMPGARGAIRIALTHGDQRRKQALLEKRGRAPGRAAAFDKAVELAGKRGEPFDLELRDAVGSLGRLQLCGVKIQHLDSLRDGSNSLLAYVEQMLSKVSGEDVDVVQWQSTGEEEMKQHVATADALRALGRKLECETWPTVTITEAQRAAIEGELSQLCPALRNEAMLPDWEFEGEHKLPIIPEPLGIISLSRTEKRVDPLSVMLAALAVVGLVVALTILFIVRPPWLPGR